MERVLSDSGERKIFASGAVRDRGGDKVRPDLISPFALWRLGRHLASGAKKYSARNWEKGMPMSEYFESLMRHLVQFMLGMDDEDHLAAVGFNWQALVHTEEMVKRGVYSRDLADMPEYMPEYMKNVGKDGGV